MDNCLVCVCVVYVVYLCQCDEKRCVYMCGYGGGGGVLMKMGGFLVFVSEMLYAATSSLGTSPLVSASFSAAIFAFFSGIESAISAAGVSSATSFTFLLTASAGASVMIEIC